MNMEKPRMLEESSTIPSRCRMGKSWDQEEEVRPRAGPHWGRLHRRGWGWEWGLLGVRTMVVRMYL